MTSLPSAVQPSYDRSNRPAGPWPSARAHMVRSTMSAPGEPPRAGQPNGRVSEVSMSLSRHRLKDGSEAMVRPIAPSDQERLKASFEQLGADSRYRRSWAPRPA